MTTDTIRRALECDNPSCSCHKPTGNVHCPAHADTTPSLSLARKNGRLLVKCFGGCDQARVVDALKAQDLWPSPDGDRVQAAKPRVVATYDYLDSAGKLVFQVCRLEPKSFRQRRPDGKDGWIWNLHGVPRIPYRLPEVVKGKTVFVCEGEKDADRLAALGLTATTNPGGAGKWRPEYNRHFQGKAVVVLPDNDDPGQAHAQDVLQNLRGVAASVKVIELPGLPHKGDVSDWLNRGKDCPAGSVLKALMAMVETAPEWRPQDAPKPGLQAPVSQAKVAPPISFVSGKELEALNFPEPVWIIPELICEGYILLAGRPKLGKSWLALCLAVAVATGGCTLGKIELRAVQGKVLYLALEDRLRRIKRRLKQILCDEPFPENLLIAEAWGRLDKAGLEDLREFLKAHDDCRLVVIDTLAKVRPPRSKNHDPYDWDMAIGGALQGLAHQYGVTILVVHHTRKSQADDALDEVSGTTGVTGSADAIMVLKRGRGKSDGTLTLAGRDIEEQELALKFHSDEGVWELMGQAAEYALSMEKQEVLETLRKHGPKTPKELAELMGKKPNSIRKLLWTMANKDEIKSLGGRYEAI